MLFEEVVGKVGRVTGLVGPDTLGEVILAIRGGTETFFARPKHGETLKVGEPVTILEFYPPRTIIVGPVVEQPIPGI
jgi:hypothetical protein